MKNVIAIILLLIVCSIGKSQNQDVYIIEPVDGEYFSRYPTASNQPDVNDKIIVEGGAYHNDGLDQINFVKVKVNGDMYDAAGYGTACTGTSCSSWSIQIELDPGDNVIYAKMKDLAGIITYATSVTITYVKPPSAGDIWLTEDTNNVTINWNPPSGVLNNDTYYYQVYRNTIDSTETGQWYIVGSGWGTDTIIIDNNVTQGETYYYWVQTAVGSSGQQMSAYSDSRNITVSSSMSYENFNLNHINIYPNPNKGFIYLEIENIHNERLKVLIINLSGQTIYCKTFKNNFSSTIEKIDLSNFPKGMYFMKTQIGSVIKINKVVIL